jgi:hypothetical protein
MVTMRFAAMYMTMVLPVRANGGCRRRLVRGLGEIGGVVLRREGLEGEHQDNVAQVQTGIQFLVRQVVDPWEYHASN